MSFMYLDRTKARKLLREEFAKGDNIERSRVALAGDEFWNSETIYEDGKAVHQRDFKCHYGSTWAVPSVVFEYADGKERRLDCFFTEEDSPARARRADKIAKIAREKSMTELKKMTAEMQEEMAK